MPHVLVAGRIHEAGIDALRAAEGITLDVVDEVSLESYAKLIVRADAVLIRTQPMPAEVIATAPRLRIVSRHGVGYDSVDVPALNARRIPLSLVGDVNSRSVAEHALMMILALARRLPDYDRATRAGEWHRRDSREAGDIAGKSLLVIGFGRIGRIVAKMAQAFEMQVMVRDPMADPAAIRDAGAVPADDLGGALAAADFVSLHIPRAGQAPVIGTTELARMKPSAFLINTARGGLVDDAALDEALRAGRLAGAGLDVFTEEPPHPGRGLLDNERVLLTPHVAGLTQECAMRMSLAAARNILDHFAGRLDPALVVNRAAIGYAAAPAGA